MGKPSDKQDSTQPLSSSQIVTVTPTSPAPIDRNDRSVWRQVVVGADDFAVAPVKRKRTGLVVAILVLLAAGIGAAVYVMIRSPSGSAVAADAAVIVPDAAVPMSVAPADAAVVVDAPADAPIDALAPQDAGVPVDAAPPPPKKKPPAKKPPAKKPPPKRHS